jgi:hypothetical protein
MRPNTYVYVRMLRVHPHTTIRSTRLRARVCRRLEIQMLVCSSQKGRERGDREERGKGGGLGHASAHVPMCSRLPTPPPFPLSSLSPLSLPLCLSLSARAHAHADLCREGACLRREDLCTHPRGAGRAHILAAQVMACTSATFLKPKPFR